MNITEATKLEELERIKGELKELMPLLSKWRVEELQKLISHHYTTRWKHRKYRKYGSVGKNFTSEELQRFFSAVDNRRALLLFRFMAVEALRITEACRLNVRDFDLNTRILRIKTEKAHSLDTLICPKGLFLELISYLKTYEREICASDGYLFFKDKRRTRNSKPYLEPNFVRKLFRAYTERAGLTDVYDTSEETIPARKRRHLHRLTSHSLRHYAITTFNRSVGGDIMLTKAYARHREISSTQVYVHTSQQELFSAQEAAFSQTTDKQLRHNYEVVT